MDPIVLKNHEDDFWKYASNYKKQASIDDVFCEWASSKNITIGEFKNVYAAVESTLDKYFNIKSAGGWRFNPDGSFNYDNGSPAGQSPETPPTDIPPTPVQPEPLQNAAPEMPVADNDAPPEGVENLSELIASDGDSEVSEPEPSEEPAEEPVITNEKESTPSSNAGHGLLDILRGQ